MPVQQVTGGLASLMGKITGYVLLSYNGNVENVVEVHDI